MWSFDYRLIYNISHILLGNTIADDSDVFGISPVGAASIHLDITHGFNGLCKDNCKTREKHLGFGIWCGLYMRFDGMYTCFLSLAKHGLMQWEKIPCWLRSYEAIEKRTKIYYTRGRGVIGDRLTLFISCILRIINVACRCVFVKNYVIFYCNMA